MSYGTPTLVQERARADQSWMGAEFDATRVPEIDVRLTYAFLLYAADVLGWRLSSQAIDRQWLSAPRTEDLAARLKDALDRNLVLETLESLAPTHPQYLGLQTALQQSESGASVSSPRPEWDIERIRMNLQRWRWLPRDLGERHVLITVPAYQMQVVEDNDPVLAMRVIVGEPETPTPFSDRMTYVVFSPFWNIPESILREETLPRAVNDRDYLRRSNIEVVQGGQVVDPWSVDWSSGPDVRFRQAPGPDNALGLVKFVFPNHFSVYFARYPGRSAFRSPSSCAQSWLHPD